MLPVCDISESLHCHLTFHPYQLFLQLGSALTFLDMGILLPLSLLLCLLGALPFLIDNCQHMPGPSNQSMHDCMMELGGVQSHLFLKIRVMIGKTGQIAGAPSAGKAAEFELGD